ncbi:TPA: hypothetical protein PP069_004863, partial [Serratia rubidaea]|nr:hypothetical protein [Serratia rubidaea]
MKRTLQGLKNKTFQLWLILFIFLLLGGVICLALKIYPENLGISPGSVWQERLFILSMVLTGGLLLFIIVFFISTYLFGKATYHKTKALTGNRQTTTPSTDKKQDSPVIVSLRQLKAHLRNRYHLFWRY